MAKFDFEVACAFAPQVAEGTYNATLDAITTALTSANGLLLGKSGTGIGDSGLSFGLGRAFEEKSVLPGTLTRPLSDFLKLTVPTFTFVFPFCGNRADCSNPPVDGDFVPLTGIDAILNGVGLTGSASGTPGHKYVFGSPHPFSSLIYCNGERAELEDCRCSSLVLSYPPGGFGIATATIVVRNVKDVTAAALPTTLTWNEQASVSQSKVEEVAHTWNVARGFNEMTITITPNIVETGDSNQTDGIVVEIDSRAVTVAGAIFTDSTAKAYDSTQLQETDQANLDQLSFQVGDDGTALNPAQAHSLTLPKPEMQQSEQAKLGARAGRSATATARGDSTGAGNDELEIEFR